MRGIPGRHQVDKTLEDSKISQVKTSDIKGNGKAKNLDIKGL